MRFIFALTLLLFLPLAGLAQDTASQEDRDFLTQLIEDNLSGIGRTVRISNFRGALSSRATFDQLTIADGEGVWLTISGGAIQWRRSALFRGRLEIGEMAATEIAMPRRPRSGASRAEARGFSLPELPVSIDIGKIDAARVVLGEDVLGVATELALTGSVHLAGGEGSASLQVRRTDGREGQLSFEGAYANATRIAKLDLLLSEGVEGIAATLLGLPGRPSIVLAVSGAGVIDDFRADVALSSDGKPRLEGYVVLATATGAEGAAPERSFRAKLSGNIAPLLMPDYQAFFGTRISLEADGTRQPTGQLDLTRLVLDSAGAAITGRLSIGADGLPLATALTVRLGLPDGSDLLLPLPRGRTYVQSGVLRLRYDAAQSNLIHVAGDLSRLRTDGLVLGSLTLDGSGQVIRPASGDGNGPRAGATLRFDATGVAATDLALAKAIGPALGGMARLEWQKGAPVRVPNFSVMGQGYATTGNLTFKTGRDGITADGEMRAQVADMGRFSELSGRPLGGASRFGLSGSVGLLSGIFDIVAFAEGRDLRVGQAEIDRLLTGLSRIGLSARRDTSGTQIRRLNVSARTLEAEASGLVRTGASNLSATLGFSDLSVLGPSYRGAMQAQATLVETGPTRRVTLDATTDRLGIGLAEVDRVLAGKTQLEAVADITGGRVLLQDLRLANPQLSAQASRQGNGDGRALDIRARLENMALLAPRFPGPLSLVGRVNEGDTLHSVALDAEGPGGTSAKIVGTIAADFATADLKISGRGQAALANAFISPRSIEGPVRFDLQLQGAPKLASLSGTVVTEGARFVAPAENLALEDARITATLSAGSARIDGVAGVRGGGRVAITGPVALKPPFDADLAVTLTGAALRDPELFDTRIDGRLAILGPLGGGAAITGALTLDETEIRVAPSAFGGGAPIPEITHLAEPRDVHETRRRAGLIAISGNARPARRPFQLDVSVSAPNRIFVRGRGLDAELGGALRLTGTTANIVPVGQFDLIRGRLDILGQRFVITEGQVQLLGTLTPYIRFVATAQRGEIDAAVIISGRIDAPVIDFTSSPDLPDEEIIAQLLFGHGLENISPFQAAQLAGAIATLSGRGGEGIVSRLRSSFGLDDLDITTGEDGTAALRAGRYLSENIYTDLTVGADGTSEINLNLDVTPAIKARGSLDSEGTTGVGLFFERDY